MFFCKKFDTMTHTKIERLRKELLEEHGDIVLFRIFSKQTKSLIREVTLSNVRIINTADWKNVQEIMRSGQPRHVYM